MGRHELKGMLPHGIGVLHSVDSCWAKIWETRGKVQSEACYSADARREREWEAPPRTPCELEISEECAAARRCLQHLALVEDFATPVTRDILMDHEVPFGAEFLFWPLVISSSLHSMVVLFVWSFLFVPVEVGCIYVFFRCNTEIRTHALKNKLELSRGSTVFSLPTFHCHTTMSGDIFQEQEVDCMQG